MISSIVFALGIASFSQALDHVKFGASRVIQPNPCAHERTGEEGVCMFAWDCLNLNGTHITFCRDRFYYGSCCKLPDGVQAPNRTPPGYHDSPSNHLDVTTRRPAQTTTPDVIEVQYGEDVATLRPPVVEVQFPRDPTPKPTIPPAVPTLYPLVPPTTQRRPIVVNNHHKKPGFPMKGTTLPPTPRPRPTEEVTTMAITEVPTGNPTWIIADEADKNGRPTTTPEALEDSSSVSSDPEVTTQRPAVAETTIRIMEEASTFPPQTTTTTITTTTTTTTTPEATKMPTTTEEAAVSATTPEEVAVDGTTEKLKEPSIPMLDENAIDATTETVATTTRLFSTRYPIRFPPKEKVTTTTEKPAETTAPTRIDPEMEATTQAATEVPVVKETETASPEPESPTMAPSDELSGNTEDSAAPSVTSSPAAQTTAKPVEPSTTTLQPTAVESETASIEPETPTTTSSTTTEEAATPTKFPTATTSVESSSTTITETTELTTQTTETTTEYDPIKAICGKPKSFATGRIVGGELTRFGKWPWMISLRQFEKNSFVHKCGAALLNEYWAVSAAHCVHNVSPNDILLRLGEYDLSGHDKEPLGHIERRVQIVATHPRFDAHTFEYDLALMRFYEPVTFADNIIPICIAEGNQTYVGETAVVTGWGRLYEDGPLPSVLQKVQIPIITNQECERLYRKAGFIEDIPQIFICAGMSTGGKDSCEGDSGGPLVLKDESTGQWNLIGIISWGIGCAMPNQPGVYTRITKFADWIKQIIVF